MEVPSACVHRVIGRVCVCVGAVGSSVRSCARMRPTTGTQSLLASVYVRHASAIRMAWVRVGSRVVDMSVRSTPAGLCRRLSSFIGDGPGSPLVSGSGTTVPQWDWELLAWRLLRVCMHGGWRALLSCSVFCIACMSCATRHGFPYRHAALFVFTWANKGDGLRPSHARLYPFTPSALPCTVICSYCMHVCSSADRRQKEDTDRVYISSL